MHLWLLPDYCGRFLFVSHRGMGHCRRLYYVSVRDDRRFSLWMMSPVCCVAVQETHSSSSWTGFRRPPKGVRVTYPGNRPRRPHPAAACCWGGSLQSPPAWCASPTSPPAVASSRVWTWRCSTLLSWCPLEGPPSCNRQVRALLNTCKDLIKFLLLLLNDNSVHTMFRAIFYPYIEHWTDSKRQYKMKTV